jgi:uroporphyrinogen-III synthase
LRGIGVAVTRDEPHDGTLATRLRDLGATVTVWQTMTVTPPDDPRPLAAALRALDTYDWVVFSSRAAVHAVTALRSDLPDGIAVAAAGPATAEALRLAGWPVTAVPEAGGAEGLLEALTVHPLDGRRMLFPASAIARTVLPDGLAARGAQVDQVTAYDVHDMPLDGDACTAAVEAGQVHAVTFASPSAVSGMRHAFGPDRFDALLARLAIAVIGPTTHDALRAATAQPAVQAERSTMDALADAVVRAVDARRTA